MALWPPAPVLDVVEEKLAARMSGRVRWVGRERWHVTLDFLGAVPDEIVGGIPDVLSDVGRGAAVATALLGPKTAALGRSVLCVPVAGLDELARSVREAMAPFTASADRDRPFVGHLTLARAQRGRSIPHGLLGVAVSGAWSVETVSLVASTAGANGPRYSIVSTAALSA